LYSLDFFAQEPILIPGMPAYFRKEEIIHNGKRYRKYNDYLTIGGSFFNSSLRTAGQQGVGLDFHFHIRRQYFQTGIAISGNKFLENNHSQLRFGYGYRKENANYNLAFFGGPTFFTGVYGVPDTAGTYRPEFYQGIGAYVCAQGVKKLAYDIGIGAEVFAEINYKQSVVGIKLLLFFSGAYRGVKRNYNPNVRSESKK
jgi:hypothetical protein